jgi:hypothetical protein
MLNYFFHADFVLTTSQFCIQSRFYFSIFFDQFKYLIFELFLVSNLSKLFV